MTAWSRTAWLDAYVEEGEAVVMAASGEVVAVAPLAWLVLEAIADRPLSTSAIAERLVSVVGAPDNGESPERLTEQTLAALRDVGLVSPLL